MRVAAGAVALLLAAVTAAGALLIVASLHAALLGEKLVAGDGASGGVSDGMRRNAAIFAALLAVATAAAARTCAAMVRTARGAPPRPLPESRAPAPRIAAGLLALPVAAAGAWTSLFAVLFGAVAAQRPDPRVPDGDPCCGHPDTWGEVAAGLAYGVATGYVSFALVAAGALMAVFAASGRLPAAVRARPRAARIAAALCLALAGAVPGSWLVVALVAGDYP